MSVPPRAGPAETHRAVTDRLVRALEEAGRPDLADAARAAAAVVEDELAPRARRGDALRAALARLGELGPARDIVERAPLEAAEALELDRVLLSRVDDGMLVAEALWLRGDPDGAAAALAALRAAPVRIDYPLVEAELIRRRRAALVEPADDEPRGRRAYAEILGRRAYLAAPILLGGRVIGFLHGHRGASGAPLRPLDRDMLGAFADGFAVVFERAVLRRRLRDQRHEMRRIASWADARTSRLSDGAIDLSPDREGPPAASGSPLPAEPDAGFADLLTRREVEVLELMVRGETNAGIARALVVSEGTVKFHVKNILRKLHASNRAEATSRYLRLAWRRGDAPGGR